MLFNFLITFITNDFLKDNFYELCSVDAVWQYIFFVCIKFSYYKEIYIWIKYIILRLVAPILSDAQH